MRLAAAVHETLSPFMSEMREGLAAVRTDMREGLVAVRTDMREGLVVCVALSEHTSMQTEMREGLAAVRTDMREGLAAVRTEMREGLAAVKENVTSIQDVVACYDSCYLETCNVRYTQSEERKNGASLLVCGSSCYSYIVHQCY